MAEVQEMMKDPAFLKEMERIKSDPQFANAVQSAKVGSRQTVGSS
jgi:hypothetical protein